MEQHYTIQQVAEKLQLSTDYVRKEIKNEHLEALKFGSELRITASMFERWESDKSTWSPELKLAVAEEAARRQGGVTK